MSSHAHGDPAAVVCGSNGQAPRPPDRFSCWSVICGRPQSSSALCGHSSSLACGAVLSRVGQLSLAYLLGWCPGGTGDWSLLGGVCGLQSLLLPGCLQEGCSRLGCPSGWSLQADPWMSTTIEDLEGELSDLREEVRLLRREFGRLRRVVDGGASSAGSVASSAEVFDSQASLGSENSYSVVGSVPVAPGGDLSRAPLPRGGGALQARDPLNWAQRESICLDIGAWVICCVRGEIRGLSGNYQGHLQSPVVVCRNWAACRALVKRGADCGLSTFIGLPSEREAHWVVSAAGLQWPI